jgi:glycosyltransferase involved in cell wall biosynthesis
MACGTPILGANMGSIPDIVIDGTTRFLCADRPICACRACSVCN